MMCILVMFEHQAYLQNGSLTCVELFRLEVFPFPFHIQPYHTLAVCDLDLLHVQITHNKNIKIIFAPN